LKCHDLNSERKLEHIDIVLKEDVEGPLTTWLEYMFLIHNAAPELDLNDVDTSVEFLGKRLSAPLIITGMTGGAPGTEEVNAALARVAELTGIGIGVGSQRAALECDSLRYTYRVVRDYAPNALVIANIGAAEVIRYDVKAITKLIDMIDANAISIHLNIAQEVVQPEGTPSFKGLMKKVSTLVNELPVPIVIKEVGFGLSKEVAREFNEIGVRYFDVAAAGGTNWVKVEMFRARSRGEKVKERIAMELIEWGIPTAAAVLEVRSGAPSAGIIASGGIRTAIDIVKVLRLGADVAGMALPILKAYYRGELEERVLGLINAIKALLLLTGSKDVGELKRKPAVVFGPLKDWIIQRDLKFI